MQFLLREDVIFGNGIATLFCNFCTMAAKSSAVPPGMEDFVVGLIGMGDMGKMYARRLSAAGWR